MPLETQSRPLNPLPSPHHSAAWKFILTVSTLDIPDTVALPSHELFTSTHYHAWITDLTLCVPISGNILFGVPFHSPDHLLWSNVSKFQPAMLFNHSTNKYLLTAYCVPEGD